MASHCSLVRALPNSITPSSKFMKTTWLTPFWKASSLRFRSEVTTFGTNSGSPVIFTAVIGLLLSLALSSIFCEAATKPAALGLATWKPVA